MAVLHPWKCALLSVCAALGGCAGLGNGAAPVVRLQNGAMVNPDTDALYTVRQQIQADCLDVAEPEDEDAAKGNRNRLITAYMFGIDLAYNDYERNLLDAVRQNDLGASTASMALSSIGSVVGIEALAQALSTTNAIVTGTHTAIGRDYLFNQTLTTLQTQMRASRAAQRALILGRLNLSYDEWTSCTALSDVLAYEQAGTLNAALAAVAASAATANRVGEAAVRAAIPTVDYATGPLITALESYLNPNNSDIAGRRSRALEAMAGLGLGAQGDMTDGERLGELVTDPGYDAERRLLIAAIIALERGHDSQAADALSAALNP